MDTNKARAMAYSAGLKAETNVPAYCPELNNIMMDSVTRPSDLVNCWLRGHAEKLGQPYRPLDSYNVTGWNKQIASERARYGAKV